MLNKLRQKKTAKRIMIALAILIIPAFALFGVEVLLRQQNKKIMYNKRIFGRPIPATQLQDALKAVQVKMAMQLGDSYQKLKPYINFENQALERLVLLAEAKRRRLWVSDKEVIEEITQSEAFKRKGQFDPTIYRRIVQLFNLTPREFEEHVREDMLIEKLFKDITKDIKVEEEETKKEYAKENQTFNINYLQANPTNFESDIQTSKEEIQEYYKQHAEQFRKPTTYNIQYILTEDKEKVDNLYQDKTKKWELEEVSKQLNLPIQETGVFKEGDPIPQLGWSEEINKLIGKMALQETAPPLLWDNKYCIIKLKEKKDSYIPPLEETKKEVETTLRKKKARQAAKEKLSQLLAQLKTPVDNINWEEIAKNNLLKNGTVDNLKYGSYIEGIGSSNEFWLAAYSLKDKEISSVIELPNGFYILQVKNRSSFDKEDFKKQKEKIAEKLLRQRQEEYFQKQVKAIKEEALH